MVVNKKLLFNYICGNVNDNIKKFLENDFDFMLEVFKYTLNPQFLDVCSINLTADYKFIEELIIIFKDDLNFVDSLVNNYLQTFLNYDLSCYDIFALLVSLYGDNPEISLCKELLQEFYEKIKDIRDKTIKNTDENSLFVFIDYTFYQTPYLKKYCAQKTLEEIIKNNTISINKFKKQHNNNINQSLLNFINQKDPVLADYLTLNLDLLEPLKRKLKKSINF